MEPASHNQSLGLFYSKGTACPANDYFLSKWDGLQNLPTLTGMNTSFNITSYKDAPLSENEKNVFKSLNEVWGDDEDGEYERLYQHHINAKHAL